MDSLLRNNNVSCFASGVGMRLGIITGYVLPHKTVSGSHPYNATDMVYNLLEAHSHHVGLSSTSELSLTLKLIQHVALDI